MGGECSLACFCGGEIERMELKRADDCRYSTGSNINTYSALIQNFYSQETAPHQAIHLAVDTGVVEGERAGVRAYVRCVIQWLASLESDVY